MTAGSPVAHPSCHLDAKADSPEDKQRQALQPGPTSAASMAGVDACSTECGDQQLLQECSGLKRPAAAQHSSPAAATASSEVQAAQAAQDEDVDGLEAVPLTKKRRQEPSTAAHGISNGCTSPNSCMPEEHQQHMLTSDGVEEMPSHQTSQQAPQQQLLPSVGRLQQQQHGQDQEQDRPEEAQQAGKQHLHKRSHHGTRHQHLLSFDAEDEDDEIDAAAAGDKQHTTQSSSKDRHFKTGGLGQATAAKFKAEARKAAAVRFTFHPSGNTAGVAPSAHSSLQPGLGLVDEDEAPPLHTPVGLTQVHFGTAQARGARPYMEDRHCVITALKPSNSGTAAAALPGSCEAPVPGSSVADVPAEVTHDSTQHHQHRILQQRAGVSNDGVARSYAAIFDGHNGAGAAETAARQLHLLLAGHPALKVFKGDHGPPAVVKQEEAAVGKALKAAFRQVDDLVLAVARREGTRDGATALVVLRLGGALYAAHAGDSRAVLCRDGQAHRLTEDHKPHLPQERQRIEDAGGRVDFQRCWRVVVEPRDGRPGSGLAVSRSLGDLDFKEPARFVECEPDVTRLALQPHKDTFVILGSDGLWDVLSDMDAVATAATALRAYTVEHQHNSSHQQASAAAVTAATQMYKQHLPQQHSDRPMQHGLCDGLLYSDGAATAAAEALLAESLRRGTMDNVTVIVMLLQWE